MKNILNRFGVMAVIAASLMLMVGCLMSGTFVIITDINSHCFTSATKFYHYHIDLTTEADWKDHKDKIDFIDAVGFDFYMTNDATSDVTFSVWVESHGAPIRTSVADVQANATEVFSGLTLAAGAQDRHITYGESLGYIKNLTTLKTVVKSGQFNYYGLAAGTYSDNQVCWDSAKAIITVSAGK